jgi:uncharacterized lipoprotein YmbA
MRFRLQSSLFMTLTAVMLMACASSPPVNYYTLLGPESQRDASPPSGLYMVDLLPVTVPAQADQPHIMMRIGDGAITPLYSDRWVAPLSDEIRSALSYWLTRDLGVPDVQAIYPAAEAPVWQIQVDVQRFDTVAGGPVLIDATWRIRPVNLMGATLLCRTVVRIPVNGAGVRDLVTGQQHAVQQLATTIAGGIRADGRDTRAPSAQVQLSGCVQSKAEAGTPPLQLIAEHVLTGQ